MLMQQVTHNVHNKYVRHEEFNGKQYVVAPMALLTEGVHHGSDGPLFYPREELAKTPAVWNMKPVVIYHPEHGRSATDPDVARRRQVGIVMGARWDSRKLRAEAWLERDRLAAVDPRVLEALEANTLMEVSTGLFTDRVYQPGVWNGEEYEYAATNYRADHVAILPDKAGACSIADGCGLLQTNEHGGTDMTNHYTGQATAAAPPHDEEPLPLPTMNYGDDWQHPSAAPDAPLVAPGTGDGCCPDAHSVHGVHDATPTTNHTTYGQHGAVAAPDGDETPLPLPTMEF